MAGERVDFDGPWKETLEKFLQPFLALCFPQVESALDWFRTPQFLDKELQATVRDGDSGRQYVDKLAQFWKRDGEAQWVLIHLEIQSQPDTELAERIYRYHRRLSDAHAEPVVSLVVLADDHPTWRPGAYGMELWGCRLRFQFPVCKLLDFTEEVLRESVNPVALVVAAHRTAQATMGDPPRRRRLKLELARELYRRGWSREQVLELYRLLDWLLPLPRGLEVDFQAHSREWEKKEIMPYITSFERFGREEGRLETLREAVQEALETRFGEVGVELVQQLESESDPDRLRRWFRLAITAPSLEAFSRAKSEDGGLTAENSRRRTA